MDQLHEVIERNGPAGVGRAAALLWHGWGVRAGDRVAWLGGNHWGEIVLLGALARIGAMLVPLNFRLAAAEWDRLVESCAPSVIVHDAGLAAAAQGLAARHGLAAHPVEAVEQGASGEAPIHSAQDAAVLLVHTSGTTGGPKAAVHTQGNLIANMRIASNAPTKLAGLVATSGSARA